MAFLVDDKMIQATITYFKRFEDVTVQFDRQAGTLVISDNGVVTYRSLQKEKDVWISRVTSTARFAWSNCDKPESRNFPDVIDVDEEQAPFSDQRCERTDS